MNRVPDLYEDAAQVYFRLVEQDCPDTAAAIHQIYFMAGAQMALRAALVMRVLKIEAQQNHYFPNLGSYAYLFEYFPEVLGLLEQTVASCLAGWRMDDVQVQLQNGNPPQESAVMSDSPVGRLPLTTHQARERSTI